MTEQNEKGRSEELEKLVEERVEELRQDLKKEAKEEARKEVEQLKTQSNTLTNTKTSNKRISRREFLKKAGLGTAGLAALMSPASADLFIKDDSFNVQTGTGPNDLSTYFSVSQGGPVNIQNTHLDLNSQGIRNVGDLELPQQEPSESQENRVWINPDNEQLKVKIGGTVYTSEIRPAIPDGVVNRLLLDEGSGTSVNDSAGSADGTLVNGGVWTDDPSFEGGTAPFFDGLNDYGEWQPRAQAPITWTCRVKVANPLDGSFSDNGVWGHGSFPALVFNSDPGDWRVYDADINSLTISESTASAEGSYRIIAVRMDSSTLALDVYENDAVTKIGSDTLANPNTTFDGLTHYFGDYDPLNSSRPFGSNVDFIDIYDRFVTDIDVAVAEVYG